MPKLNVTLKKGGGIRIGTATLKYSTVSWRIAIDGNYEKDEYSESIDVPSEVSAIDLKIAFMGGSDGEFSVIITNSDSGKTVFSKDKPGMRLTVPEDANEADNSYLFKNVGLDELDDG